MNRCTVTRLVLFGPPAVIAAAAVASTLTFLGWLRRRELGDRR